MHAEGGGEVSPKCFLGQGSVLGTCASLQFHPRRPLTAKGGWLGEGAKADGRPARQAWPGKQPPGENLSSWNLPFPPESER